MFVNSLPVIQIFLTCSFLPSLFIYKLPSNYTSVPKIVQYYYLNEPLWDVDEPETPILKSQILYNIYIINFLSEAIYKKP